MKTVSIVVVGSVAPLLEDVELLAQAAETSLGVRQRRLDFLDSGAELVRIDLEALPTGVAGEVGVQLELADGLRCLAAAVRAGDFDGVAVEDVHGCPSRKMV